MTLDKELLVFLDQESFDYYDLHSDKVSFCPTHFDAKEAVKRGDTTVVTFSPCMLSFDYVDLGYKIYAIKNDRKLECKFNCTMEGNDKEIKRTHNLMKLVLGGAFDDFFENTDLTNLIKDPEIRRLS